MKKIVFLLLFPLWLYSQADENSIKSFVTVESIKPDSAVHESFSLPKSLQICGGESVTWTEDVTYADEIRVCTGSTLTIKSEVGFVPDGKLIVERGGKLILDGGVLTNVIEDMPWKGIELWGTASATQNPIDQGWVEIINEGMIENALVGIKTCKMDEDQNEGDEINYDFTGGIVQASEAVFRNNRFAVIFYDYSSTSASYFDDCDFVLNDNYIGEYDPGYFVRLNSMHGIDFTYCRFKNESSNNCYGKGIYGFNSGFRVQGKYLNGNPFNGEFLNLKRGIYATSGGTSYFPEIAHTDFTGNFRGVFFSALQLGSVKNCTIETGPTCAGASYGIYLDNSSGYEIEGNHISPEDYDGIGIAEDQGADENAPDAPAGNRFSWIGPTGVPTDINNEAQHVTYYYHVDGQYHLEPQYYTTSTVIPTANTFASWIPDESCPSNIDTTGGGGQGKEGLKGMIATAGQKADSIGQLIQALEDAGDTESLQWEVDLSTPSQSLEVYNELMGTSPYVSDTVMATAIEKESVLADAMIRDVMVANPESAKDDVLLQKLEERTNPLPEYMLGQILQGRSLVSVYGDLMARQSYYKQQKAQSLKKLKHWYMMDTIDPMASRDSLMALLRKEHTLNALYGLAFMYGMQGSWNAGRDVIDSIPVLFSLTDEELQAHGSMADYFELKEEVNGLVPDSLQVAALHGLAMDTEGRARVYARNSLLVLGEVEYEEPVLYPNLEKSAQADLEHETLIKQAKDRKQVEVFPNPAGDYMIVKWELEKAAEGLLIRLGNSKGQVVLEMEASGRQNQQLIKTGHLEAGVYVVSLYANGNLIDSEKVSIVK